MDLEVGLESTAGDYPNVPDSSENGSSSAVLIDEQLESTSNNPESDPKLSPEYLQRKLYFLIEHLKKMHNDLPERFQMKIPYELLTGLANVLLDDVIFDIVKALMEIQHVTEKHLLQQREQVQNEMQIEIHNWREKIRDQEELDHILNLMKMKHENALKETDMKLILMLDQKVQDQQSTLEKANVPGFYVTENPKEIKIQMFLLDFILRLSRLKFEQDK